MFVHHKFPKKFKSLFKSFNEFFKIFSLSLLKMFLIENLDILILNEENPVKRNNVVIINPKNQTIAIKSKKNSFDNGPCASLQYLNNNFYKSNLYK